MLIEPPTSHNRFVLGGALVALWLASTLPLLGWGLYADTIYLAFHHHFRGLEWYHSFYRDSGCGYVRPAVQLMLHAFGPLFGTNALAWDLTAALFHLGAAFTLWLLACRWLGSRRWAWVAAAMFCIHFAHWTVHCWFPATNDSVLVIGMCLALYGHCRWFESGRRRDLAIVWLGFVIAALGKEHAILLAPSLALFDAALWLRRDGRVPLRRWAWRLVPITAACAALFVGALTVQNRNQTSLARTGELALLDRRTVDQWCLYVGAQLWPYQRLVRTPSLEAARRTADDPPDRRNLPRTTRTTRIAGSTVVAGGFLWLLASALHRRWWRELALLLWMAGMAVPSAMVLEAVQPRYAYPPSPAAMMLLAALGMRLWRATRSAAVGGRLGASLRAGFAVGLVGLGALFIASAWASPSREPIRWHARTTSLLIERLHPVATTLTGTENVLVRDLFWVGKPGMEWVYVNSVLLGAGYRGPALAVYSVGGNGRPGGLSEPVVDISRAVRAARLRLSDRPDPHASSGMPAAQRR